MAQTQSSTPSANLPQRFGILIFPGFQALDAFGPLDALNILSQSYKMELAIIAETLDPVSTQVKDSPRSVAGSTNFGQSLVPTHTFSTAPDLDMLIIPGGWGTTYSDGRVQPLVDYVARTFPSLRWLFTICTGATFAAAAGVLDGRAATTNKAGWRTIVAARPQVKWDVTKRWVRDAGEGGKVWTTSGVTAGIDGMYAWIAEVFGEENAEQVANLAEYVRNKDPDFEPFAKVFGLV
ncbi:MAG: hypothetical protein LQ340_004776 [Diploschistes diacapsis]|nr:MAG: hypothetical protein LQ340_004776 [Diploschistes diacapsis]